MSIEFSLDNLISIFFTAGAISSSIFLGISLISRKARTRSTQFLGFLLILGALTVLNTLFANAGIYSRFKNLYFIPLYYTLSFGPLTYFYVKTKINPGFEFRKVHLLHAILPVAQATFYFAVGFRSYEFKSWLWQNVIAPWYQDAEGILFVLTFLAYIFVSRKEVLKERNEKQPLWKQQQKTWLLRFLHVFVILVAIEFAYGILSNLLWGAYEVNLYNIPWASFPLDISKALVWYWVSFNGFQNAKPELAVQHHKTRERKERYQLSEDDISKQVASLDSYFENERPFLNPDFNLNLLAKELDTSPNKVSFILNEGKGMNFNEFVNQNRVEEVKKRMRDPEFSNYTILSIALGAGFNSKATFNRVFKSITGSTPKQYLEQFKGLKSS